MRTRSVFLSQGLTVAVMDAPSDRQEGKGLLGFRQSPEHMQDIAAVMRYLRQRAPSRVWLVGTSLGTASVTAAAIRTQRGSPNGIVLTSSIVEPSFPGGLPSQRLGAIKVPTLLVHHEKDECKHTLFKDVPPVVAAIGAPAQGADHLRDGGPPRVIRATRWGYHGYPASSRRSSSGSRTGSRPPGSRWPAPSPLCRRAW